MKNINDELCKTLVVHKNIIDKVRKSLPDHSILSELTEFFKVFSDPTRIKILKALLISEMCVCDLAVLLESSQSAISHQLRILRHSDLVKFRKEGKVVFYSLKDDHIKNIIDKGMEHINER